MNHSARTVTPRVLWADARRHQGCLRVFCDSPDWASLPPPVAARDPEWLYHQSAMEACATVSARLFCDALGLARPGSELGEVHITGSPTLSARAASVITYLEALSGSRCGGERELLGRSAAAHGTIRGILAVLRHGGRFHPAVEGD